jgi:hypothetical protein
MEEKMRAATTAADDDFLEKKESNKRQQLTILPEELILEFINECIVQAAMTGNAKCQLGRPGHTVDCSQGLSLWPPKIC